MQPTQQLLEDEVDRLTGGEVCVFLHTLIACEMVYRFCPCLSHELKIYVYILYYKRAPAPSPASPGAPIAKLPGTRLKSSPGGPLNDHQKSKKPIFGPRRLLEPSPPGVAYW